MRAIDTRGWLVAASLAGVGCHDEPRLQVHPEPPPCVSPDRQVDAICVPPGVQDDGCEAGARLIDGACEAVMAARCPPGEVPVIGSEACEALMDCGTGTWGDLAIDASTQHVDGAYGGGASDGSAERPWITIGAAVGAAVDGARVVVAAGSYAEDVVIENKRIALWGVCPTEVTIVGTGVSPGAVFVRGGADGSELGGVSIVGAAAAVLSSGSEDVVVASAALRNGAGRGVELQAQLGATSLTLSRVRIDANHDVGIASFGASLDVRDSVIAATQPDPDGNFGRGVVLQVDAAGTPAHARLSATVIEDNHDIGVLVSGSSATLDAVIVRATQPQAIDGRRGRGVNVQLDPFSLMVADLIMTASVIEDSYGSGLSVLGSRAELMGSVVRDTRSRFVDGAFGRGIAVEIELSSFTASQLSMFASRVERSAEFGVLTLGSSATIVATHIADTHADGLGGYGDGISAAAALGDAALSVSHSKVERSTRAALGNFGAIVSIADSALSCQAVDIQQQRFVEIDPVTNIGQAVRCGCPTATAACVPGEGQLEPPSSLAIGD